MDNSDRAQVFLRIDPKLAGISLKLWRFRNLVPDPAHTIVSITNDGQIKGETEPRVVPETELETSRILDLRIHKNMSQECDPDYPSVLPIDEAGNIMGEIGLDFDPELLQQHVDS